MGEALPEKLLPVTMRGEMESTNSHIITVLANELSTKIPR